MAKLLAFTVALLTGFGSMAENRVDSTALPPYKCSETTSDTPPFNVMTTSQPKNPNAKPNLRNWESLLDSSASKMVSFVPKNSIVRLTHDTKLPDKKNAKGTFVSVEVLSAPGLMTNITEKQGREPLKGRVAGKNAVNEEVRAKPFDKGYIEASLLDQVDKYTFVVTSNAKLLNLGGSEVALDGKSLKLAKTNDGKYRVNECCTEGKTRVCTRNAIFTILNPGVDKDGRPIPSEFKTTPEHDCSLLQHLRPIENDQVDFMVSIVNLVKKSQETTDLAEPEKKIISTFDLNSLESIDSMGLIKIPSIPAHGGKAVGAKDDSFGPFSSLHYSPDKGANVAEDSYMNATAACAFMRVLEEQQRVYGYSNLNDKNREYQIQWGDAFHPQAWKIHRGHESGNCIDLRPLKKDADDNPVRVGPAAKANNYNFAATRLLMTRLKKAGATTTIFNDRRMPSSEFDTEDGSIDKGTTQLTGHDDHIHVCFDPKSPKVQETCKTGYPKK